MKVKAVTSFAEGKTGLSVQQDEVLELPEGADWLQAGLVVPVAQVGPEEKAVISPTEKRASTKKATKPLKRNK